MEIFIYFFKVEKEGGFRVYETNYDLFLKLKLVEPNDLKRHTLEGLIILASPIEVEREGASLKKSEFGAEVGEKILSHLQKYIHSEIIDSHEQFTKDLAAFISLPKKYQHRIPAKDLPLLLSVSLKLAKMKDAGLDTHRIIERIGMQIEDEFERFYTKRELNKNPAQRTEKQQRDILNYETFFFGINSRDILYEERK